MTSPLSALHASNALTYASLLCGVAALWAALHDSATSATACGALLALAVICDTFDGQFARRMRRRASRRSTGVANMNVGGELDSLVDAVTFGAIPIVCASVLFKADGMFWWAAAFVYIAAVVTRLSFYSLAARAAPHSRPDFIGLPSPVAALFWSTVFLFDPRAAVLIAVALSTGIAMIAPFRLARPSRAGLAAFVLWPASLIVAHTIRAWPW